MLVYLVQSLHGTSRNIYYEHFELSVKVFLTQKDIHQH